MGLASVFFLVIVGLVDILISGQRLLGIVFGQYLVGLYGVFFSFFDQIASGLISVMVYWVVFLVVILSRQLYS